MYNYRMQSSENFYKISSLEILAVSDIYCFTLKMKSTLIGRLA